MIILCVGLASSMSCNVAAVSETKLCVDCASSTSCSVVAVWRSCFMWVVPALYPVMLLLSGDYALCGTVHLVMLEPCFMGSC